MKIVIPCSRINLCSGRLPLRLACHCHPLPCCHPLDFLRVQESTSLSSIVTLKKRLDRETWSHSLGRWALFKSRATEPRSASHRLSSRSAKTRSLSELCHSPFQGSHYRGDREHQSTCPPTRRLREYQSLNSQVSPKPRRASQPR